MTAPVAVVSFMNYEGWDWGRIAAGGVMVMLPVLVFLLLVGKFLVEGRTAASSKAKRRPTWTPIPNGRNPVTKPVSTRGRLCHEHAPQR